MIKDTFFSMPRFVNLCRKEMVENWKSNVLRIILLYGVMTVVIVWIGYMVYSGYRQHSGEDRMWSSLLIVFMWSLWGFGCLNASFTMEKMKSKTSRLSMLMIPATPFEKFFSRWFIYTIVYLVVFLIAYRLADYTRVLVYSLVYPEIGNIAPVNLGHMVGDADYYTLLDTNLQFITVLMSYFFVQSCFVLGSSIWPKNSFLKTFAAGTIITMVYVLVSISLGYLLLADRVNNFPHGDSLTEETTYILIGSVCVLLALFNWTLAYFRFKESEIINRM